MTVGIDRLYSSTYELRYEERRSKRGHIYGTWKKVMPRISDQALNCVIYLYPSVEDAENGEAAGGTGFLVGFKSEVHEDRGYIYAVTNSHVIREGGAASPVIRLNTRQGEIDILDLGQDNWVHHQDGDDLAISMIHVDPNIHRYNTISPKIFLTKELIEQNDVGPGDDVFMVGRFVNHEGRQRNLPTARFGNISMMPWEPIKNPLRGEQESFLVETRSLGGYSGSPVFLHILPYTVRGGREGYYFRQRGDGPWLLGIDWGHLPVTEKVKSKIPNTEPPDDLIVESNSGQMGVVPAWRLQELLYQEEVAEVRRHWDDEITKRKEGGSFILDAQTEHTGEPHQSNEDSEIFTEDEFEDALDRTSRRELPSDQES